MNQVDKIIMIKNISTIMLLAFIVADGAAQPVRAQQMALGEGAFALPKEKTVYSPQVMEMLRYDRTSLHLNTGCIDLSIPLVDWVDKDFDFPVSISYNSSGFRPREPDNYVGRNWILDVGGVVYRHVNGVPDDKRHCREPLAAQAGQEYYVDGFLSVLNKKYFNLEEMERDFQANPYKYTSRRDYQTSESTLTGLTSAIESSADVFYFSFGKHSGKFMINYDGSVSACGRDGGRYEVNLDDMSMFDSKTPRDTRIHIKTDDGYVYTFGGGGYSSLEYNIGWEGPLEQLQGNLDSQNEITAYHLTEVKAPNGRKMTITYRDIDNDYHINTFKLKSLKDKGTAVDENLLLQYSLSGRSVCQVYNLAPSKDYLNNSPFEATKELYTLTKSALIDNIVTDQATIRFHYSKRGMQVKYEENTFKAYFPYLCGAKLDKIELQMPAVSKEASLVYEYQAGGHLFLRQVKTTDRGTYSFGYNGFGGLTPPTPLTSNIDHWGYWRGRKANNGIIPAVRVDDYEKQDYVINSDDRNSTGEDCDCTLLHEVTYPTGGKTVFHYEANWYSRYPSCNYVTNYHAGLSFPPNKNAVAGGARVYSITHYGAGDKAVKKSIFTYGDDMTMGEMMYMPYYKYIGTLTTGPSSFKVDYISADSEGITDLPYPAIHIRYPEVTEHFVSPSATGLSEAHPYKVTNFIGTIIRFYIHYKNDFVFPTYPNGGFEALRPETYFPSSNLVNYNMNLLAHPTLDASLQYGKIEQERYYNSNRKLVQRIDYKYSFHNMDKYALRTYAPCPHFKMRTGLYTHFTKEPLFEFVLDSKTTSCYTPGNDYDAMKINEKFAYNRDGYLTGRLLEKADNDSLVTLYAYEYHRSGDKIQMLPTEKTVYVGKTTGRQLLQRDSIGYRQLSSATGQWYVPKGFHQYAPDGQLISLTRYIRYDSYGNPVEVVGNDGKTIIYLWGYKGQYLQAKMENCLYEEVKAVLGVAPEILSESDSHGTDIGNLYVGLPHARIHTYTYKPGMGVTSETSPDRQTIYYDYDAKGRLTETYRTDENGKIEILQLNDYHLINE